MKTWLYTQLNSAAWPHQGLSPVNRIIVSVISVAAIMSILETEPTVRELAPRVFRFAEFVFGAIFTVEYLLRLWSAGEDPHYAGIKGRVRFVVSLPSLIDLVAVLPFFLTAGLQDAFLLRLIRLFRIFSLAKLGRHSKAIQNIGAAVYARRYELLVSLFAALTVMLFSGAVLHIFEGDQNPESFGSIPRALWWGAATLTSVGYGDAYPVTAVGKICSVLIALAAVGIVAMPTGILAAAFSEAFQNERAKREGALGDE